MKAAPPEELLLLVHEVLEMQCLGQGRGLGFDDLKQHWRTVAIAQEGDRILSLWAGPEGERTAILCRGAPDWVLISVADFRLAETSPHSRAWHSSFLSPGLTLPAWGRRFVDLGLFLGWWTALDGATGLRLTRHGQPVELAAQDGHFLLIDWTSSATVERFDAIRLPGRGWVPTVLPRLPYDATQLWRGYTRHHATLTRPDGGWQDDNDAWASEVFNEADENWTDLVVAVLRVADAARDGAALNLFGAQIYGNDAAFFARLEAELTAGTIQPQVLERVLGMERAEHFDAQTLAAYHSLANRCRAVS